MKDDIKILLNRREEIQKEINKLQKEYAALGNILTKIINMEKEEKKEDSFTTIKRQIEEQTRNGRTDILINPSLLREIGYIIPGENPTMFEVGQLKKILKEYGEER